MKIVINQCFGGFGLSEAGTVAYWARKGISAYSDGDTFCPMYWTIPKEDQPKRPSQDSWRHVPGSPEDLAQAVYEEAYEKYAVTTRDIERDDPDLVAVVEELGEVANGLYAALVVVEVPDGVQFSIQNYDGQEHIAEVHRTWG